MSFVHSWITLWFQKTTLFTTFVLELSCAVSSPRSTYTLFTPSRLMAQPFTTLSLTERTPVNIQLCLRSRIGLWEKYYYALFDITQRHYFCSDVGFTNIVVRYMGQSGAKTKYIVPTVQGQCLSRFTADALHTSCNSSTRSIDPNFVNFPTFVLHQTWDVILIYFDIRVVTVIHFGKQLSILITAFKSPFLQIIFMVYNNRTGS